jgi:hypothetical protein
MAEESTRYERRDFRPKAVAFSGLGLIVLGILAAVFIHHFEKELNRFFAYRGQATWTSSPTMQPPAPRLQTDSTPELAEMRAQEDAELHSYGWVDRQNGVIRIPIDEAMRLMLERGYPVRPSVPSATPKPAP